MRGRSETGAHSLSSWRIARYIGKAREDLETRQGGRGVVEVRTLLQHCCSAKRETIPTDDARKWPQEEAQRESGIIRNKCSVT